MHTQPEHLQQLEAFLQKNPDIETFEVLITDLNGLLRGKWLPRESIKKVFSGDFKMPLSTVVADIWGRDVPVICDATGDGDGLCTPILSSLKRLNWLKRPTAQLFLQLNDQEGPCGFDPRVVLKNVASSFQTLNLRPVSAPELEFFLVLEKRQDDGTPIIPNSRFNGHSKIGGQVFSTDIMQEYAEVMHGIRESSKEMQLPLDTLVKELAPGQFELNLHHIEDPVIAADNAQMLKRVIKGVAQQHGFIASFMAKPFAQYAGNGLHTHISVLDENGRNIFNDDTPSGSQLMRFAIGGLAQTMNDTFLLFAPHLNSYRRLKANSHAPVTPTWGYENREAAMRIPNGCNKARRIEYRVGGADANPYLTQAAILAGILHGLENEIEPSAPLTVDSPKQQPTLPRYWSDALRSFEQSSYIPKALGADFHHAYSAMKQCEQREFESDISRLEYDTYLVTV
jgi:glutamine synthetase